MSDWRMVRFQTGALHLMTDTTTPAPARRASMRNLRTGLSSGDDDGVSQGRPSLVSERQFLDGLRLAIVEAAETGRTIPVFRVHGCLLPLQQWNDMAALPDGRIDSAIERVVLDQDRELILTKTDGRGVLGYSTEPLTKADAERFSGRLMLAMAVPMGEPGNEFVVSPRLGVAIIDRVDTSAEWAVDAATRTLRQTNFEVPFLIYNDYVNKRSVRQGQVGADLPAAIADRQISIEYQPRMTTPGGVPVGFEVFPRWHHDQQGTIPAVEFLRVAEQTGRLVDLGYHIRDLSTEIASEWQWDDALADCRLWMNMSPVELCHDGMLESLIDLRRAHANIPLGLEVTDVRLLEDPVFTRIFDRLEDAGIMLALDNLRASAMSIGRLQRLPMRMINLDGELVRSLSKRPANRELVRFICAYARSEDKLVTACGIETIEQLRLVTSLGVHFVQGNIICEPLPGHEVLPYLAERAELD